MAEITDNIVKEAQEACKPNHSSILRPAAMAMTDMGIGIATGVGTAFLSTGPTPVGIGIGALAGGAIGLVKGLADADTPTASCVAKILQDKSKERN